LSLDPSIAIAGSNNLVWQMFKIVLSILIIESTTNESLAGKDCVCWVCDCLSLCWNTYQSLFIIRESHNRWSCSL